MSDIIEPLLDRRAVVIFIEQELGLRIPLSSLNKLVMAGRGPTPTKFYGRRCLYTRDHIRQWAAGLMTDAPRAVGVLRRLGADAEHNQPEPPKAA